MNTDTQSKKICENYTTKKTQSSQRAAEMINDKIFNEDKRNHKTEPG